MSTVVGQPLERSVTRAADERRPSVPSLLWRQVRHANTSFWRTPIAAFFTLLFPLIFLLLIGALAGNAIIDPATGLRLAQFLTPSMAVFGTAMAAFSTLAISVAVDREAGVLKRLRGSPLPVGVYVLGRIGSAAYTALLSVVILVAVGVTVYGVDIVWSKAAAALLTLVVGIACLAALGLAVAALVNRSEAVGAVANGLLIPLAFISGVFATGAELPTWLDRIAGVFPLRHFVDALSETFNPFHAGGGFVWESLAVMLAWAVAAGLVAVRFFRWEPSHGRADARRSAAPSAIVPVRPADGTGRIDESGRPSVVALLRAQVRHANRAFWRNKAAAFFTVGFPVMLVLLLPQVFGNGVIPDRGVDLPQFLTPVMAVYGVAATAYLFLAQTVAAARERAILKRAHGTPLPVWAYLGGQIGAAVFMSLISLVTVVGSGVAVYGVEIVWAKVPALLAYVVLGIGCFAALGMAVAALAPGEKAASTIANVTLLPLAFVSDIFIIGDLPSALNAIGWAFPLKHLANAVADTFNPTIAGTGWNAVHLLVLIAWTVGGALLAARFFRWEPRRSS
jgi:ABC-2 type transport system permease protein